MNKALFADVDGTLIRWVFFDYWIRACVEYGLFPRHILIELDQLLSEYKQREQSTPFGAYLKALVRAVKKDGVLRGKRLEAMQEVCRELARRVHGDVHVFTRELIATAHSQGYLVAFVSGSPTIALEALAKYFPGVTTVYGTELPVNSRDRFSGVVDDEVVYHKDRAVQRFSDTYDVNLNQSIAIGDSPTDVAMFSKVGYPMALNPNSKLFKFGREEGGFPIVIEKKTVIAMKATPSGSRYTTCSLESILPKEIARPLYQRLVQLEFM